MSNWWNRNDTIPFSDGNYIKIVDFYQHKCPVVFKNGQRVAHRGFDFKAKGWNSNLIKTFLCEIKKNCGHPLYYKCCKSNESVEDVMPQADTNLEAIVYKENCNLYKTQSIFYAIRNAFAHSSFSVVNNGSYKIYYLESSKDGIIKAQIRLKETTLLHWIDIFNGSYSVFKKKNRKRNRLKPAA